MQKPDPSEGSVRDLSVTLSEIKIEPEAAEKAASEIISARRALKQAQEQVKGAFRGLERLELEVVGERFDYVMGQIVIPNLTPIEPIPLEGEHEGRGSFQFKPSEPGLLVLTNEDPKVKDSRGHARTRDQLTVLFVYVSPDHSLRGYYHTGGYYPPEESRRGAFSQVYPVNQWDCVGLILEKESLSDNTPTVKVAQLLDSHRTDGFFDTEDSGMTSSFVAMPEQEARTIIKSLAINRADGKRIDKLDQD